MGRGRRTEAGRGGAAHGNRAAERSPRDQTERHGAGNHPEARGPMQQPAQRGKFMPRVGIEDRVVKVAVPVGARFKGYSSYLVQDLVLQAQVIRYRREKGLHFLIVLCIINYTPQKIGARTEETMALCKADLVAAVLKQLGVAVPDPTHLSNAVVTASAELKKQAGIDARVCLLMTPIDTDAYKGSLREQANQNGGVKV